MILFHLNRFKFLKSDVTNPKLIGAGTVGDIATPGERGKYMGMVTMGPMLGPCIGYVQAILIIDPSSPFLI